MINYVQIGTKDGNDEFNQIVRRDKPDRVILVEPNKEWINNIKENYKDISNVTIITMAITGDEKDKVTLYRPAKQINGIEYDPGKFSLIPMDDWGDDFITMTVDSCTFNELCDYFELNDINFLQIDTEGYDSEIIKSIDFNRIKIDTIKYEIWHFPTTCFTRHGEKGKEYGWAGMKAVEDLLVSKGYVLEKLPYDIIAHAT